VKMFAIVLALFFLGCASFQAQTNSPKPVPEQGTDHPQQINPIPKATTLPGNIDPAKVADIRQLMEIAGIKAIMTQMLGTMADTIRPLMTNALPAGEYREKLVDLFFVKFRSKADPQMLMDSLVPLYDKYLSADEVKGLIQFYQTPLGQKTVKVMPKLVAEAQEEGRKWGEGLGRDSMIEVLSEHPELQKAMEDARKATSPQ
jgi:hypothetical protein